MINKGLAGVTGKGYGLHGTTQSGPMRTSPGQGAAAVVISSAEGRGGTWAGAIENLQYNWVLLWVRQGEKVPDGNNALMKNGAKGIKEPLLIDILENLKNTGT